MKNHVLILSCFLCLVSCILKVNAQNLCPNIFKCGDTLFDTRDTNKYPTLHYGTQCWFQKNLDAHKFSNGDSIPNITNNNVWAGLTTPASCRQSNSLSNEQIYGLLYNWWVVVDSRGVCPKGWYVPTLNDWNILVNYLGGASVTLASAMKSTTGWGGGAGNNSTGFSALGSGWRTNIFSTGAYGYLGYCSTYWTTDYTDATFACFYNIDWEVGMGGGCAGGNAYKLNGFAVRCVRDY